MTQMCGTGTTGYPAEMIETTSTGTPVVMWAEWRRRLPPLDVADCPALILVAPHPDDETLGLGATAALLSGRGITVQMVAVTDGEQAYPRRGREARPKLAEERREELIAAASRLGLPRPWFLGLPDGKVEANESRVVYAIEEILEDCPAGTWCASTWRSDGQRDHEAAGRAAAKASANTGAVFIEYPLRMWRWARPDNPAVPWDRARRVPVTELESAMKAVAVHCFASQLRPTDGPPALTRATVDRLLAMDEIVFV
jgi:LmbE family N-acetylglucosaminyl deacetylase